VEVLHALVAADRIDLPQFEAALARLLAARSEAELAAVAQAPPPPVAMTPPERRLARPLRISGTGRLRLRGRWQLASQTTVRAELGSVTADLTNAEFDDRSWI
jgi:hypothetical protein